MKLHPIRLLPILVVAVLWLFATATPAFAETAPTTCSHNANTTLAGRIVLDADHDNWPDAGEGVAGVAVRLLNVHNGATTLLQTVETNSEGCYQFSRNLLTTAQLHRVTWEAPHQDATLIHDPDNGEATTGTVARYEFVAAQGAPYETDIVYRPGSIQPYLTICPTTLGNYNDVGGMVAIDHNGNNQADPGEGVAGIVVTLAVVHQSQVVAQTVTDINGCYLMTRNPNAALKYDAPTGEDGIQGNQLTEDGDGDDIQGCCNYRGGDGDAIQGNQATDDIQGNQRDINERTGGGSWIPCRCEPNRAGASTTLEATTFMFVRAHVPQTGTGANLVEAYDPNGRQTAHIFYEIVTTDNGTFESDFLYRDATPTSVTVARFGTSAALPPAPIAVVLTGFVLLGATVIWLRR